MIFFWSGGPLNIDIWHIVRVCYVLMCFSCPLKITLLANKNVSPPTVWPRRLKQTSFCRKLNYLDCHNHSFRVFDLLPVKAKNMQKMWFFEEKKLIYFSNFHFSEIQKTEALRPAPSVCKWKKNHKFCYICEIVVDVFSADPLKAYIFYTICFLYVFQ